MFKHLPPADINKPCICLIRHGQTDWNAAGRIQGREDIELNPIGRQQALETAQYLQQWQWDAVISSPLKRAYVTAEIIAQQLKLPSVQAMDEFMERDFGECSGLTTAQRKHYFPDGHIPGQETLETLQKRVLLGLNGLKNQQKARVLVVAHGGVINALLAQLSKGEIGTGKTILHNACLNLFQYQQEWQILAYNLHTHLHTKTSHIIPSDRP